MSGAADTEGARGKAIDLVSQNSREGAAVSPEIVSILVETLRKDKNPGVRRKAAEALVQLPPTETTRDALVAALKGDENPAIRILAVEGLAKAATQLRDSKTIDSLREKAADANENGYVRGKAALALKKIDL
jgi:HEAT repeat protein